MPNKLKSNNYSELTIVNVADMWRERNMWYQGRSRQQVETEHEKGYWRMAQVLNPVITNKIITKLGYTSMLDYYLVVCEN